MSTDSPPLVGIVMGSDSDWPVMRGAADALAEFGVPHEVDVVSAHRMPHEMVAYGEGAAGRGLKAIIADKTKPMEERFAATLKLAEMPRNSSTTRIRNRCELTGRSRAYYRKFRLSRIMLRELANKGLIPGVIKSSW